MSSMSDLSGIFSIFAVLGGFIFVIFLIVLAAYIFQAIGLYQVAKHQGRADIAWLAWIPIGNLFLIGTLVGTTSYFGKELGNLHIIYPIGQVVSGILYGIPFIGGLLSIAWLVFSVMTNAALFGKYEKEGATKYVYGFFTFIGFPLVGSKIKKGAYTTDQI